MQKYKESIELGNNDIPGDQTGAVPFEWWKDEKVEAMIPMEQLFTEPSLREKGEGCGYYPCVICNSESFPTGGLVNLETRNSLNVSVLSFFFIIFSSFSEWRGLFLGLPSLLVSQGKWLWKVRVYFLVLRLCVCSVAQLCPTLYDSMDCSPTGSSVHGIFQARLLQFSSGRFSHLVVSDSLRPQWL